MSRIYKDNHNHHLKNKLSRLGALVSLATDDIVIAERTVTDAKARLEKIQREIEQLYITLEEPFFYTMD